MSDRVQETFGLSRSPFDKDVPADSLWMGADQQSAIDRLIDTATHQQHGLVIGESGIGKNCVTRGVRHGLSPTNYRVEYVAHVTLGRRDFLRQLCFAMEIETKATPASMFEAIQRTCSRRRAESRLHTVVVLDEMHLMPDPTLTHLHLLANFEWDSKPLLSMILVGLPELHDRLKLGIHRSLLTRIHTKVELSAGSPELTSSYVRKRMADAGARSELFMADGLAVLHELTGGILRSVDVLALAALRLAAAEDKSLIDRNLVRRALHHTPLA